LTVARIYLDTDALALAPTEGGARHGAPLTAPGALDALRHLRDGGHHLLLIGHAVPDELDDEGLRLDLIPELPASAGNGGAWLVTGDPAACARRVPGLRTLLVGPRRARSHRPAARCDVEARDLGAAAIEILTREAM
jgi:hypothetical protein